MESSPDFLKGSKKSELIEIPLTTETKKTLLAGCFSNSSSRISLWVLPHSARHILEDQSNAWNIGEIYQICLPPMR